MAKDFQNAPDQNKPRFWHDFINSKLVTTLLTILLILIIIFLFTKLSYLFTPIAVLFEIFGFPVIASAILFYLFSPLVNRLSDSGVKKPITVFGIFIFLILVISLSIGSIVPIIREQSLSFVKNMPSYYETLMSILKELPFSLNRLIPQLDLDIQKIIDSFSNGGITQRLDSIVASTFGGLGSIVGTVTTAFAGLLTIPILTYYLLVDSQKIPKAILYYIPNKYRESVSRMLYQGNYQVSQYIRGQIIVAICVGILFAIGYAIIGLEYGTTLAVLAGVLNIIPYLGSIVAVIPALIIGLITSPIMLIKVIIVMMVEQTIEGRFISPQVLGNSMQIHPVTILMVLLASGRFFGLPGIIIGIPTYAILKVICTEIYSWYRENNKDYHDEVMIQKEALEEVMQNERELEKLETE